MTKSEAREMTKRMPKKSLPASIALLIVGLTVSLSLYFFGGGSVKAQETIDSQETSENVLKELEKERALLETEKERLDQIRRNLESFQVELDKRYKDYLAKSEELKKKEKEFNDKVEGKMVDRQTIETYENIDPEQASILMINLYKTDASLATLVMRKIAGKKAGKILEAMIPMNAEVSTKIAEEALKFYKPKQGTQK